MPIKQSKHYKIAPDMNLVKVKTVNTSSQYCQLATDGRTQSPNQYWQVQTDGRTKSPNQYWQVQTDGSTKSPNQYWQVQPDGSTLLVHQPPTVIQYVPVTQQVLDFIKYFLLHLWQVYLYSYLYHHTREVLSSIQYVLTL